MRTRACPAHNRVVVAAGGAGLREIHNFWFSGCLCLGSGDDGAAWRIWQNGHLN